MIRLELSRWQLIVLSSLFLTATANLTFFDKVLETYPLADGNSGFVISLTILLTSVMTLLLALFSLFLPLRPVLALFFVLAALTGYYSDEFGAIVDDVMLENILQTDAAESMDLINIGFVLRFLMLAIIPLALLSRVRTTRETFLRGRAYSFLTGLAALVVAVISILPFSDQYASFFREHKALRYNVNPLTAIHSTYGYAADRLKNAGPRELVTEATDAVISESDTSRELVILVVGETVRWDRLSLNGYGRKTTPLLEQEDRLVSYNQISSCGTSTAISVPCMFSINNRADFDLDDASYQENALDILHRAGVSVLWRDNNSSSKGVADRVTFQDFRSDTTNPVCDTECRDIGMLSGLQEYIDQQAGDVLIVLHQMGNHGPAYYKRYPPSFEHFTPACQSAELSSCTGEEINNAYDNAILYTDYFLSEVIAFLKTNTPRYETVMLYVSDHGESLGEHGLYLHGAPYMLAPSEQVKVPVVLWLGESADIDLEQARSQKDTPSSHDALFHSLLAVFEVESTAIDGKNQFFDVE